MCKESGREYAVKIVDRKQEESITESIAVEIQILRSLPHHKHISKSRSFAPFRTTNTLVSPDNLLPSASQIL